MSGILEKKINEQVDKIIGTSDGQLNTIMKLSLMRDFQIIGDDALEHVLEEIRERNRKEAQMIEEELKIVSTDS